MQNTLSYLKQKFNRLKKGVLWPPARGRDLVRARPQIVSVVPVPSIEVSVNNAGIVLLNRSTGEMFVAKGTSAEVWAGISQGRNIEQITFDIAGRYDIADDRAERDIRTFVDDLARNGLVKTGGRK